MTPAATPTVSNAVQPALASTAASSIQPATVRLSVVIVNHRQWPNTARLAQQLLSSESARHGRAEVVIVDNHSPAHRLRRRLRRTNGVSVRCFGQNRGFGRGVNEGCRLSRGDWFLLLNPDVTVTPGFLDRALDQAERIVTENPAVGVIGFQLRHADGSRQGSVGRFPTLLNSLLGQIQPRAERKCPAKLSRRPGPVAWLTGCGLLIRRDCYLQVGGFDPSFFLYYEDVDFCRRARASGWSIWFEPALRLTHCRPLHVREVRARLRLLTRHALLTYARKHWSAWQFRAVTAIVWLEAIWRERRAKRRGSQRSVPLFRRLRRVAADFWHGRPDRAYRRVWQAAQVSDAFQRLSSSRNPVAEQYARLPN